MSIVDSDDLQSEITDITVVSSKSLGNTIPDIKAFKELCMAQTNILNILQGQINSDDNISTNRKVNNWLAQKCTSGPVTQLICNKKNCEPQESNVSNCYYSENEINKLKEKLNHIINSLGNKKYHKTYLTVIDELLDWVYNIILNNIQVTNSEPNVIDSVVEHNKYIVQGQNHETSKKSGIYCPSDCSIDTEYEDAYNDFMRERMFSEVYKTIKNSSSDSENEIFDRVSEISNGQILQQEELLTELPKCDINSNFMHQITMKNKHTKNSNAVQRSEKVNDANFNDSSINITEDERECSKVKMSKTMKHNELLSQSKEAINRILKPTVINSVPVVMNNTSNDLKHFMQEPTVNVIENGNKDIKEWNKKTEETSSIKFKNKKKSISSSVNKETKLLSSWVPKVIWDSNLDLIFEGNLIKESGHIIRRKFKTDPILCRKSPKLIETIYHEFYTLVGELSDTNDVVPKNLIPKCRRGCPLRIKEFCEKWKLLQSDECTKQEATDVDVISIGRSLKGRRIIPPLKYWTGERVFSKGNNTLYTPSTSQAPLAAFSNDNPGKKKSTQETMKPKNNKSKESNSRESKVPTTNT
ncbi:uncharacterized protein LOC143349580 [Colletes latitarsis]|uniref:uncharacterized protein LOC143349580 n=1 Tax=Colletes latitarsis TaxID=2605962 RepID=UPI004036776C